MRDAEGRVQELEQKEGHYKNQVEKLTREATQHLEELKIMKKENEQSASQDTTRADIKEKYNQVLQENKKLKSKIEAKSLREKFNQEQELGEAKREGIRLEAKNM